MTYLIGKPRLKKSVNVANSECQLKYFTIFYPVSLWSINWPRQYTDIHLIKIDFYCRLPYNGGVKEPPSHLVRQLIHPSGCDISYHYHQGQPTDLVLT